MNSELDIGVRVVLKSFNEINATPSNTPSAENYWLLIGDQGTVVEKRSVGNFDARRVLVLFDKSVSDLGLECHNKVPNSLWILVNDLRQI